MRIWTQENRSAFPKKRYGSRTDRVQSLPSESYYIEIHGLGFASSPNYELSIDAPGVRTDVYGSANNNFPTAVDVGDPAESFAYALISTTRLPDFFRFTAGASGTVDLALSFNQTLGDADLYFFDENLGLLASTARELVRG